MLDPDLARELHGSLAWTRPPADNSDGPTAQYLRRLALADVPADAEDDSPPDQ